MVQQMDASGYATCDRCGDRYRVQGLLLRADGRRVCVLCARGIGVPPRRNGRREPRYRPHRHTRTQRSPVDGADEVLAGVADTVS